MSVQGKSSVMSQPVSGSADASHSKETDLAPFCSTEETRFYIMKPWSRGEYTFATNGHILVRVPRRTDIAENDLCPDAAKVFAKIEAQICAPLPAYKLPDEEKNECSLCEGGGKGHDCPDCECACANCDGKGEVSTDDEISAALNGLIISLKYLRMVLSLPNVKAGNPASQNDPMRFEFDGGDGAVMGLTRKHGTHIKLKSAA